MKILIPLLSLLLLPSALQAQIYRCAAKGDTYFSQIPCADNSETVVIEDRMMFSAPAEGAVAPSEELVTSAEAARTPADNMQEFISTLRKQRTEQLEKLDLDIGKLEAQLNAIGDTPSDTAQREAIGEQMTGLQVSRSSIVKEYESMIVEAERRLTALSAVER